MSDTQSLQRVEPMPSVTEEPRSPQALMRRATDVAGICREIVLKTAVTIQGRKFVRVEGWESIAIAHGCFAGAENAERVYDDQGNHIGYKAKGVLRNAHGDIIATGEGFVGFDEHDRKGNPTWKGRDEYAGRAMAQTRAISRTCRGVFAHVIVLIDSGLSTTPAEEVPDGGFDDSVRADKAKPVRQPPERPRTSAKPAATATEEQKARWLALLKPLGNHAVFYARHAGWIMPPSDADDPGQPLEAMDLRDVPTTKASADAILRSIQAQEPHGASGPPSTTSPTAQSAGKAAKQAATAAQSASSGSQDHHKAAWYNFPVPFGKHAGVALGKLDKNVLFGFWANYTVETEYNGRPKKAETIERDQAFRDFLDQAGEHYQFEEPDNP